MKTLALLTAALVAAGAAGAQTVWRCGADGKVYSDSPCVDGRPVVVADARSAQQQASAQAVLARDRALAHELVRERRQREYEARAQGSGLAGIKAAPKPEVKTKVAKAKEKEKRRSTAARGISPSMLLGSR